MRTLGLATLILVVGHRTSAHIIMILPRARPRRAILSLAAFEALVYVLKHQDARNLRITHT